MASATMGAVVRQLERLFATGGVSGLSEGQLLDRFVSRRDEAAFEALVARHGPMVLGVCRRLLRDPNDVDDAFQATFLVLVRKAGSLRRRDLLGNWLYGVAHKVAARSRAVATRRAARETSAAGASAPARESGSALPELHEEVQRLPDRYRVVVVLCYLEGLTHEEAADRLGWPVGTVKGRLARARDLLRGRLTRRGLTLASGAAVAELLTRDASAAVPAALAEVTLRAASHVAAGHLAAAGLVSTQAIALSQGVIHAMSLGKLKLAAVTLVLAGSVLSGAGVLAYQGAGPDKGQEPRTGDQTGPTIPRPDGSRSATVNTSKTVVTVETRPAPLSIDDQIKANQRAFEALLFQVKTWDEQTIDRVVQWSRVMKEAEDALNEINPRPSVSGSTSHRDRMRRLHELTQRLSVPNQPQLADVARVSFEQAQRELNGEARGSDHITRTEVGPKVPPRRPGTGTGTGIGARPPAAEGSASAGPTAVAPGMIMGGFGGGMGGVFGGPGGAGGGFGGGMGGVGVGPFKLQNMMRTTIADLSSQVASRDKSPGSKAILKKLDERISMSFGKPAPLEDVLKYIKSATQGPDDSGIPIYLDPDALNTHIKKAAERLGPRVAGGGGEEIDPTDLDEKERRKYTTVTIDLEGVPLRTSLRLLLKQLDLAYCVKDGVLIISSVEGIFQELREAETAQLGEADRELTDAEEGGPVAPKPEAGKK